MVTSDCPFSFALNFTGTEMSCFSTIIVSYEVFVSLGTSTPQDTNPAMMPKKHNHFIGLIFISLFINL